MEGTPQLPAGSAPVISGDPKKTREVQIQTAKKERQGSNVVYIEV